MMFLQTQFYQIYQNPLVTNLLESRQFIFYLWHRLIYTHPERKAQEWAKIVSSFFMLFLNKQSSKNRMALLPWIPWERFCYIFMQLRLGRILMLEVKVKLRLNLLCHIFLNHHTWFDSIYLMIYSLSSLL